MRILVVGMGLIGGSICKSIKAATSHAVYGCDVQQAVLDDAIADGAIDGTGTITDGTYDMIVLCLHQRIAIQMVQEALPKIPAGTILVDTCGLKGRMVRDLTYRCRKAGVRYVGTHPMAGRRKTATTPAFPTCSRTPTSLSHQWTAPMKRLWTPSRNWQTRWASARSSPLRPCGTTT